MQARHGYAKGTLRALAPLRDLHLQITSLKFHPIKPYP